MASQPRVDKSLGLRRHSPRGNSHHEPRIPRRPGARQSLSEPSLFRHGDKPNRWLPPNPAAASSHAQTPTLATAKPFLSRLSQSARSHNQNRPLRQFNAVLKRHLQEVGNGDYSDQFPGAIDAALGFLPHNRPQNIMAWQAMFPKGLSSSSTGGWIVEPASYTT